MRRAAEQVRGGNGPFFLELRTYRFRAHSMFDPELYRDKDEVEGWKKRRPDRAAAARWMVTNHELSAADAAAIEGEVTAEIDAAVLVRRGRHAGSRSTSSSAS